jgi:hypothetical protein
MNNAIKVLICTGMPNVESLWEVISNCKSSTDCAYLYNALLRSSSSGGEGGSKYARSEKHCSNLDAHPNLLPFLSTLAPRSRLPAAVLASGEVLTGSGEDDCRVRDILFG